jgi:hypothetical protein
MDVDVDSQEKTYTKSDLYIFRLRSAGKYDCTFPGLLKEICFSVAKRSSEFFDSISLHFAGHPTWATMLRRKLYYSESDSDWPVPEI